MTEFERVYREYFRDVELYLMALCKDAHLAEELTAQTFFKAMEALPKFRGECDIRTWLCALAKNRYLSYLRKHKQTVPLEELHASDPGPTVEERVLDQAQAMAVHKVLHSLPEPYKEVFSLRVFGQLSFSAIGELFGKTPNWACVTYHRARQKIKDAMEVQNGNQL